MGQGESEPVRRLLEELGKLPGVGPRTAERLAYHILRLPGEEAMRLAFAIRDVKKLVRPCTSCGNLDQEDPCAICSDAGRDRALVMVVETPKDLAAVERCGTFRGVYHVLGGRIAPLDGVGADDLRVAELLERVGGADPEVREVILATNPDLEGDGTALHLAAALEGRKVRVTRIARGIPAGSSIEYSSGAVLADAIEGRRPV